MSKKSDRRAAEREARRAAFLNLNQQRAAAATTSEPATQSVEKINTDHTHQHQISEAQLAANRANAQHSTGPTTPAGQARSSMNALKHGLTGKTVVLPSESLEDYTHHLETYINKFRPANDDEMRLVRNINDSIWRISRIQHIEFSLHYKAELEFADKLKDRPEAERVNLSSADAFLKYEKQLHNLNLQEARLRRYIEKDTAELARLQNFRRSVEAAEAKAAKAAAQPRPPQPNGFDFSTPETQRPTTIQADPKYQKTAA